MLFNKGVALCGTMMLAAVSGQAVAQTVILDEDNYENEQYRDSGVGRLAFPLVVYRVATAPANAVPVTTATNAGTTAPVSPAVAVSSGSTATSVSKASPATTNAATAASSAQSPATSTPAIFSPAVEQSTEYFRDADTYVDGSFLSRINISSLRTLLLNLASGGLANLPAPVDTGNAGSGTGDPGTPSDVVSETPPAVVVPDVPAPTEPVIPPVVTEDPTRGPELPEEPAAQTPTEVIKEVIDDVVETVTDVVKDIVDTVVDTVETIVDAVVDAVTGGQGDSSTDAGVTPSLPVSGPQPEQTPPATAPETTTPSTPSAPTGELPAVEKTFDVYDRVQLREALLESLNLAGAIIRIHPGEYGSLVWTKRDHAKGRVFLIGATDEMPVFTMINLTSSKNVAMSGLRIASNEAVLLNLSSTSNIIFTASVLTSANPDKDPWDNGNTGIHVRSASHVTIEDVTFEDLRLALYSQRSANVKVRYNTMHYLREGINVAATDGLLLERNYFTEFYPNYGKGEHPDTVQFWNRNEEAGVYNAKLIENVMIHGGCRAVQGLFLGTDRKAIPHRNLEIRGNVYYGSSSHGITVDVSDGVTIANNVVAMSPWGERNNSVRSADGRCSGGYSPRMRAQDAVNVSAYANIGMATPSVGANEEKTKTNNWKIFDAVYGGLPWEELLNARPTADTPKLEEFLTKEGSAARAAGAGILVSFPHGDRKPGRINGLLEALALHNAS
ncbi:MAG: hypothetical protein DI568_10975 [Sphingomonas sp.]|nr:MAG: hypothetical protein DI568_10975 [Sphingomonas sp.]